MPYTSISIVAPSSAKQGAKVTASITVKNITQYHYSFKGDIYAVPDRYPDYVIGSIDQIITSGSSVTRNVSFTMPDCNVTVFIWLERWSFDHWAYDNSASKVVSLEAVAYTGSISKKELEYNETRGAIPASNVPQNKRGLIHIWGRNDMATSQNIGIHWVAKDPGGKVVEDYEDWKFGTLGSGQTHEFIGGRFDINKTGTWTIAIGLFMNPSAPVQVASYNGTLCAVVSAVPEYPVTDIKDVIISLVGVEYPVTDIKDVVISLVGVEYPVTDIKDIIISVVGIPVPPVPPVPPEEEVEKEFPWVPVALIAGGVVLAATSIKPKTKGGG